MKAALAGHAKPRSTSPEGITFVEIDHETGKLATPTCPRVFTESFLVGTEPIETARFMGAPRKGCPNFPRGWPRR